MKKKRHRDAQDFLRYLSRIFFNTFVEQEPRAQDTFNTVIMKTCIAILNQILNKNVPNKHITANKIKSDNPHTEFRRNVNPHSSRHQQ